MGVHVLSSSTVRRRNVSLSVVQIPAVRGLRAQLFQLRVTVRRSLFPEFTFHRAPNQQRLRLSKKHECRAGNVTNSSESPRGVSACVYDALTVLTQVTAVGGGTHSLS